MTESEKRVALWGSLFIASVCALIWVGGAYPLTLPLWLAAMIACFVKGELWDAGEMK